MWKSSSIPFGLKKTTPPPSLPARSSASVTLASLENRDKFPRERLAAYAGQLVAWWPDGSHIFDADLSHRDPYQRLKDAGIVRLQGQTMTVVPRKSACYRCLFREPPPAEEILNCQQAGILGAVAGTVGSIQATEAIKYLAGFEEGLLTDRLLTYDAKSMTFHMVDVNRDVHCAACGVERVAGSSLSSST